MTDQKKIVLMTKLALYEKKYMKKDQSRLNYYIEDYIYVNNFRMRLGITIITCFFIIIGAINKLNNNFVFPTSLGEAIGTYVMPYFFPWLIVMIIYSFVSTGIYGRRYQESCKRFSEYSKLLKQLEGYDEKQDSSGGAENEIE